MTGTMVELLTTALESLSDRDLGRFLAPSCSIWLENRVQPKPINGWVVLLLKGEQIDFQAAAGSICIIARGGVANDVYTMAKRLGLFGIYAGWFDRMTYVASVN